MTDQPFEESPQPHASLQTLPTVFPPSAGLETQIASFYLAGPELEAVIPRVEPPGQWLEILERLGPSPFERGGFPVIGFLATTYEKVSRFALERVVPHNTPGAMPLSGAMPTPPGS